MVGSWGAVHIAQERIMKTKLLALFSLLALLLVSTAILADGRPTGIRITRAVSGGNMNVEIDISVTGTNNYYTPFNGSETIWIGNRIYDYINFYADGEIWVYASSAQNVPLPWAIDWGDGSYVRNTVIFDSQAGPWVGAFAHTYMVPGSYVVTVGSAVCCQYTPSAVVNTGNLITSGTRYVWTDEDNWTFYSKTDPFALAITNTATVNTGTGIPTLNIYGLLAMAFVLVGTGVLLFRKPTVA